MPRPKPAEDEKSERLDVRVSADLAGELERCAEEEDPTLVDADQRAVKQYLNTVAV